MTPPAYLAVFDCDGTLVDSQHTIVTCMQNAFADSGLQPVEADAIRHMVGLSLLDGIARLAPGESTERHLEIAERYRTAFQAARNRPDHDEPLYPGARECLEVIENQNIVMAVATGKGRRGLETTLSRHSIRDRFSVLKTADDGPGKPNPAILLDAIAESGASPETTVMIGDTVFDMELAKNANVSAIGVSWGYHPPGELKRYGADMIVRNYHEVPAALKEIWRSN
ncbi:MAG: HAD-IA family hydrolase [Alphaproteobacteria bacterium]